MAYTLHTSSFGALFAYYYVDIREVGTGLPATVLASAQGGFLSDNGRGQLDVNGAISVYLDGNRQWAFYLIGAEPLFPNPDQFSNDFYNAGIGYAGAVNLGDKMLTESETLALKRQVITSRTVQFYTENTDWTDDLSAFLLGLQNRLQDEFAGDPNNISTIEVDCLGRTGTLSDLIWLDPSYCGITIKNFSLSATNSSNWASVGSMLKIGDQTASARAIQINLENFSLNCNRYTSGLLLEKTTACGTYNANVSSQTGFGIKAWISNRRLAIRGGALQEWGNGDVMGKTYANRTSVGLWVEKSDGFADGVTMPINKVGIYCNNIRNFLFDKCHPWMGDLDNEADRYNAWTVQTGTVSPDPEDSGAAGLQFNACYFDHGPVVLQSAFAHQFDGCTWTGGETGIYPFVMIADSPLENACGFKAADIRISQQHNPALIDFRTTGAGTWDVRKLYQIGVVSRGSDRILPSKFASGIRLFDSGNNGNKSNAGWDNVAKIQISDTDREISVAGRAANLSIHSQYNNPGMSITKWGSNNNPSSIYFGYSRSTTVGTFGGFPVSGDTFGRFGATGDTGTNFGTTNRPGAYVEFLASENWTSIANGTCISFGTTPNGQVGNASERWRIDSSGDLKPAADNAYNIGTAGLRVKSLFVSTFASVPETSAIPVNNGEMRFERTSNTQVTLKLKGSDGVVRSVALTLA